MFRVEAGLWGILIDLYKTDADLGNPTNDPVLQSDPCTWALSPTTWEALKV